MPRFAGWVRGPDHREVLSMGSQIDKLLSLGSAPLGDSEGSRSKDGIVEELADMLEARNGFFAFESALLVRPSASKAGSGVLGLGQWNAGGLWRNGYDGMAGDLLFFAEDIFGGQFAFQGDEVWTFDPETGESTWFASDLEGWAEHVLAEHEVLTGFPLAHEWQQIYGQIPVGQRLVPKIPFVLGGAFSLDNLFALNELEAMRYRADIAVQIRDLPEGATVNLKIRQ
jgi:hypothetical protein